MLKYRGIRRIYQISFFVLFCFLIYTGTQSWSSRFEVSLFTYFSPLSVLTNVISQHNITAGMILAVFIVSLTLFFGRFFCGWICPMGTVQHFATKIFKPTTKSQRYEINTYSQSHKIKYIILIVFVFCSAFGVILSGWLDPLSLITRFSVSVVAPLMSLIVSGGVSQKFAYNLTVITGIVFVGIFLLNIYMPRLWCRTICPLGALLSLFSLRPMFRIVRDNDKCIHCGLCHQHCQGACQPDKKIIHSDCLMCMTCIDVCPTQAIRIAYHICSQSKDLKCSTTSESGYFKQSDSSAGIKLSRRDFIVSGVIVIFSLGVLRNIRDVLGRGFGKRIRPPGSLSEENFLARCVRCGQCINTCPTNVLQPAISETNIEGLWTPILNMRFGYCEYDCVRCSQVCPTGAIQTLTIEQKHKQHFDRIGTAFVDRSRCLPWAFGRECLVCQEVCPTSPKAIYFQYRKFIPEGGSEQLIKTPYVDPEQCIGCGACEYNCPVQDKAAIYITSIGEHRSSNRKLLLSSSDIFSNNGNGR